MIYLDKVKVNGNRVLVEPLKNETVSAGGIILPEQDDEDPEITIAKVIKVGPGRLLNDGSTRKPDLKEGDLIIYDRYSKIEIVVNKIKYFIIYVEDILAIVES